MVPGARAYMHTESCLGDNCDVKQACFVGCVKKNTDA